MWLETWTRYGQKGHVKRRQNKLYVYPMKIGSNISKTRASCFIGVSNTRKLMKARDRRPSAFIVFECLKPRWNTKHEFLKLLLQQKKISLNYHLNKVSQFNYYIWDVKCAWCAWSYHLTVHCDAVAWRSMEKGHILDVNFPYSLPKNMSLGMSDIEIPYR